MYNDIKVIVRSITPYCFIQYHLFIY